MPAFQQTCPQCGTSVPAGAPAWLCPRCLLGQAMETLPEGPAAPRDLGHGPRQLAEPPRSTEPGVVRFGDYELLEELGRGGMGVVYRARQLSLNRIVAVKMLLFGRLAGEGFIRRFRAEANAAASLRHPNIVAIHEVGEHDGQPYFSMDYIEGKDLETCAREAPLSPRKAATYLRTVAEAIHYSHQGGLLHRDLKPSNILIDLQDVPHVTDFGLAKRWDSSAPNFTPVPASDGEAIHRGPSIDPTPTATGQVLGTLHYMPPEQVLGASSEATPASDVYALGAVLYRLLTGRPPVLADTMETVLVQMLQSDPVPPRLLNANVPRDLETICLKCLSRAPADRYASAGALAEDLGRQLRNEPIQARPVSNAERGWRWCRRNPVLATAMSVALVSLLAIVLVSTLYAARLEKVDRARKEELYRSYLEQIRAKRQDGHAGCRAEAFELIHKAAEIRPSLALRSEAIASMAIFDVRPGRTWHPGHVPEWVPYYFDGAFEKYAVPVGTNGVQIRRVSDDMELARLDLPGRRVGRLHGWSPDGRFLAVNYLGQDHWTFWEVPANRVVLDDPRCGSAIAFGRGGGLVATADRAGRIVRRQLPGGEESGAVTTGRTIPWLALNARGDRVLAGNAHDDFVTEVLVWTFGRPDPMVLPVPEGLSSADWGGDDLIAAGAASGRIYIWDAKTGALRHILKAHDSLVQQVRFNHRGDLLASTGWDGTTRFSDPASGTRLLTLGSPSQGLEFSLDDARFSLAKLALGPSSRFAILHIEPGLGLAHLQHGGHGRAETPWSMGLSPDARFLAVAHGLGIGVKLYDPRSRALIDTLPECGGRMVLFEPGGGTLLTGGEEGLTRWPIEPNPAPGGPSVLFGKGVALSTRDSIINGSLTPDGRWLACLRDGATTEVVLFDLSSKGTHVDPVRLGTHEYGVHIAISPDGQRVASADWKGREGVKIWRTGGGALETNLPMAFAVPTWSPDARWLAMGCQPQDFNHQHRIWDTRTWKLHYTHTEPVFHGPGAFSRDSRHYAFVSEGRKIVLLQVDGFRHLATFEAQLGGAIEWLEFSQDGRTLAALDRDHRVQLWDLAEVRSRLKPLGLDWE